MKIKYIIFWLLSIKYYSPELRIILFRHLLLLRYIYWVIYIVFIEQNWIRLVRIQYIIWLFWIHLRIYSCLLWIFIGYLLKPLLIVKLWISFLLLLNFLILTWRLKIILIFFNFNGLSEFRCHRIIFIIWRGACF